jgi:type IV secretory pathway VirB10-like protein
MHTLFATSIALVLLVIAATVASCASAFHGAAANTRATTATANRRRFNNVVYSIYSDKDSRGLAKSEPRTSRSSSSLTGGGVFYPQQQQQEQRRKRLDWNHALREAATTFATFREMEAADVRNERVADDAAAAKRKASATSFAAFASNSRQELLQENINAASLMSFALDTTPPHVVERALVRAAAALGKKTGQVFGGALPENYID